MIIKEEVKIKLKELVEQFSSASKNKDFINSQNEEYIKWNYLEPLLKDVLGWKTADIEKEKRILKGRADYMLKLGNEEVLVVEAKKAGTNLSEDEGRQAVSYAYHRKVKFAIVTNFKEIKVYHALTNIKQIDHNLLKFEHGGLFRFSFEQFIDNIDNLMFLSRESFEKKEVNKLLPSKIEKASKPIDESILDDLLQYRDWLSKDLKKTRMHLTKEQIDEVVQMLIDRLIFMRSVEDRGLESANFLLGLVDDVRLGRNDKTLWSSLKDQFKTFDKSYNSKLFAEGLLEKEGFFDEQTLIKVIRGLYFGTKEQQARYMFDEIPGDLLGNIYEQYLGTILSGTEKRVKLEESSGKRKKMGIFYTPSYIVDYIVKNTVGEYIKNKTIDEILEVKIVDPACGSGSFIVRAFQEVCNAIEDRLKKGEKGKMPSFQMYKDRLSFSQKISILTQCIHGVDLDEKAVELAQLNLLLKLLEEESPESHKRLLPNLRENIKCGNSLIEDYSIAGDKAFKWEAQFKEVFNDGGFDIVIGNPPYVRVQELSYKDIDYFKKRYLSAYKRVDIAVLFFEKANEIIKIGGLCGFISSNQFLVAEYGRKMREFLIKNYEVQKIIDFGDLPIFESALTYVSIFVLKKGKAADFEYIKIKDMREVTNLKEISGINIRIAELNDNTWTLVDKKETKIIGKLNSFPKLSKIGQANAGIITGLDDILMFDKKQINELGFEKELVLPIIRGGDHERYGHIIPNKYILYPYKIENSKTKVLTELELKKYPFVYQYLLKNKGLLSKRKDSRKTFENRKDWFALVRFGRKDIFNQIKIVTPGEVKNHKFSLDSSCAGFSCARVFAITIHNKDYDSKYVLALLNSNTVKFYLRQIAQLKQGGYYTYSSTILNQVPIKDISKEEQENIIHLVDKITELKRKLYDEKISGNEKERLEQQFSNIDYEIDQEVYKLYGITKEEQKIIEESLK